MFAINAKKIRLSWKSILFKNLYIIDQTQADLQEKTVKLCANIATCNYNNYFLYKFAEILDSTYISSLWNVQKNTPNYFPHSLNLS